MELVHHGRPTYRHGGHREGPMSRSYSGEQCDRQGIPTTTKKHEEFSKQAHLVIQIGTIWDVLLN